MISRRAWGARGAGDTAGKHNLSSSGVVKSAARPKSGKSRFGLSSPRPALINFDRSEDWLLQALELDILRDRIVLPQGEITVPAARTALAQFSQDLTQAKALSAGGACETIFIDGGSQLTDIITLVTLDEAKNPNKTFRYAERNAYIRNLFNDLNECGLNVVWTSKARSVWVGSEKVPNLYAPDCHDDIPFMVDVNVQMVADPAPEGQAFYGVVGTNAFRPQLVGKRVRNLEWGTMLVLLGVVPAAAADGNARIRAARTSDSGHPPITPQDTPVRTAFTQHSPPIHPPFASHGDLGEVQR